MTDYPVAPVRVTLPEGLFKPVPLNLSALTTQRPIKPLDHQLVDVLTEVGRLVSEAVTSIQEGIPRLAATIADFMARLAPPPAPPAQSRRSIKLARRARRRELRQWQRSYVQQPKARKVTR